MKILTLLFVFLVAACDGGGSESYNSEGAYADIKAAPMEVTEESMVLKQGSSVQPPSTQQSEIKKKVIKKGGLSYKVDETKNEYSRLSELLTKYEAYIASENESKGYDRINYSINIKVPPQNFDPLIEEITKNKTIENRWVNADDVTARYYDLQSRIENKKKLEERYQEILKKAENVRDILEVERNLNQVRGEIESLQGQFKLLTHQVNYSTIDLTFYQLIPYEYNQEQRPGFGTRLLNAFSGGWNGFLTFLVIMVQLWPFGLVAAGLLFLIKRIRGTRKSK